MARSSLSDIQGSIIDPSLSWNFDMVFDKLPTGMSGDVRALTIRCQTTNLPGVTHNQVEVNLHGITLRYRGRKTYGGTFDCAFAENVDWSTYEIFRAWNKLMLSWQDNTGSSSAVYKVPATIIVYDDAGTAVKEFGIHGVWPQVVQDIQFDGSSDEYVQPNITFSYDYTDEE